MRSLVVGVSIYLICGGLVSSASSSVSSVSSPSSPRCSLNGAWRAADSACTCRAAWTGPTCAQLDLLPMSPGRAERGAYRPGKRTSWGANVLRSPEDGLYHMFVAEMKADCTLTSWIPNSQVVHATSATPAGPFAFKELLFDTFHHNPRLVRDPKDGAYLLFMIGGPHEGTAGAGNCSDIPPAQGELLDTRIIVSRATSLNGPWSTPSGPLIERGAVDAWDYVVTNPSPIILANGTTLMYYRGTPKYWGDRSYSALDLPESVGVAIAPHWSGPYRKLFKEPILKVMNEDPFAWRDSEADGGGFHLLTHGRNDWWNTHHSWSEDGLTWSDGSDIACDPNITLTNGSIYKFTNRERPRIFFNETTGRPAMLFNGVCPGKKYTYSYTLSQDIRQEE